MMVKKKEPKNVIVVCTAIVCLTLLEAYALSKGVNGLLMTSIVAAVAGLAGWSLPQLKILKP